MLTVESLSELLRDNSEVADLLQACGESVPAKPANARKRLVAVLDQVGGERILDTLFGFAAGFARMSHEIFDFCERRGVGIAGQIQLRVNGTILEKTRLVSRWAFTGRRVSSADITERAHALASEISAVARVLDPDELVTRSRERYQTMLGKSLHTDPVLRRALEHQTYRTRYFDSYTEGDLRAVGMIRQAVGEAQGAAAHAPVFAAVASALAELEGRCAAGLHRMAQAEMDERNDEPGELLATALYEVQILVEQAAALARDADEGERASDGFSDFLRSEFWAQRWRVYEIWLLARVLDVLEQAGGEIRLNGVESGLWTMRYGRARDPVASAVFPEGEVDVYYQLFRDAEDRADMPDLAVIARDGRILAVVDPKHGYSYTLSPVQKVLTRYALVFDADLTAVVNYFPVRGYPFDLVHAGGRRQLLASQVSPGSAHLRRLELQLVDVLLAAGFGRHPASAPPRTPAASRQPARGALLFYWTSTRREHDEPSGAWGTGEQGGPVHLAALQRALEDGPGINAIDDMEATPDGNACVLRTNAGMVLLQAGSPPRVISTTPPFSLSRIAWNRQGTRLLFSDRNAVHIHERGGALIESVTPPIHDYDRVLGWTGDGESVICASVTYERRLVCHVRPLRGVWKAVPPLPVQGRTAAITPLSATEGTIVSAGKGVLLQGESVHEIPSAFDGLISVSPGGDIRVFEGPSSVRWRDGVKLLNVVTAADTDGTLVRFLGEPSDLRWSPDQSRFAFIVAINHTPRGAENRLMQSRIGDRHAFTASLPGQDISCYAWISTDLLKFTGR